MTKSSAKRASLFAVVSAGVLIACAACTSLTGGQPVASSITSSAATVPPALQHYQADWFDAARKGRWDILQPMIAAGYPIDAQNNSGYTAAILAAYDDHPDTLQHLMAAGANACLGDKHGNTALMGAIFKGNLDVTGMLLDAHCDINAENYAGESAFVFAVVFGRRSLFDSLLDRGANPAQRDQRGQTVTDIALAQQNSVVIAALNKALSKRSPSVPASGQD